MMAFKEAAGIFYEDRFIPIIESIINLVASIIFLKLFGLPGVALGTITSTLIVFLYSYPKYVYKGIFDKSGWYYVKDITIYLIIASISLFITYEIINLIVIPNAYLKILLNAIICIILKKVYKKILKRIN